MTHMNDESHNPIGAVASAVRTGLQLGLSSGIKV